MTRRRPSRRTVALLGTCALGLAAAPTAGATANVEISAGGRLGISVPAVSGPDGNHGVIVEPFRDSFRNTAFRMRQVQFGDGPFASNDSDCFVNGVVNDAVCGGPRTSGGVAMGDGADRVVLLERPVDGTLGQQPLTFTFSLGFGGITFELFGPVAGTACVTSRNVGTFDVALGGGDDLLLVIPDNQCSIGTFPERGFLARLDADGGTGNDVIQGGPPADRIGGGPGNDLVDGGGGDDSIAASSGTDDLRGGEGDDTFLAGSIGSATIDGGPGTDTVSYSPTTAVVGVTIGDDSNSDGFIGLTDDKVQSTVERVISGSGRDSLSGSDGPNTLVGNAGDDVLRGEGGTDRLEGGSGNDTLSGGLGRDTLVGGPGDDVLIGGPERDIFDGGEGDDSIDARDGNRDGITCGPGFDTVTLDLREPLPGFLAGCESASRNALDDGPPGAVTGRTLRLAAAGTTSVVVACPRGAKVTCRGRLTLRRATRAGQVLAGGSYVVRRGRRATVSLTLRGTLPRPGARVTARTVERGASTLGPRSAVRTLTVRRGA